MRKYKPRSIPPQPDSHSQIPSTNVPLRNTLTECNYRKLETTDAGNNQFCLKFLYNSTP